MVRKSEKKTRPQKAAQQPNSSRKKGQRGARHRKSDFFMDTSNNSGASQQPLDSACDFRELLNLDEEMLQAEEEDEIGHDSENNFHLNNSPS